MWVVINYPNLGGASLREQGLVLSHSSWRVKTVWSNAEQKGRRNHEPAYAGDLTLRLQIKTESQLEAGLEAGTKIT
jgi:hypothetical protein